MKLYILWRHDRYKDEPVRHRLVTSSTDRQDVYDFRDDVVDLNKEDIEDGHLTYSIEEVRINPEHCPRCFSHNFDFGHYPHMRTCCDCGKIFSKGD